MISNELNKIFIVVIFTNKLVNRLWYVLYYDVCNVYNVSGYIIFSYCRQYN